VWGAGLSGNGADGARELAEDELFELHFGTGIVDIDADETAAGIVVELHTLRDLPSLDARFFGKVDI
jgi:DNA repair protein RadC